MILVNNYPSAKIVSEVQDVKGGFAGSLYFNI